MAARNTFRDQLQRGFWPCTEPVFANLLRSRGIDSQPCGPVRQPHLLYWSAKLHRLVESIPGLRKRLQTRTLQLIFLPVHEREKLTRLYPEPRCRVVFKMAALPGYTGSALISCRSAGRDGVDSWTDLIKNPLSNENPFDFQLTYNESMKYKKK